MLTVCPSCQAANERAARAEEVANDAERARRTYDHKAQENLAAYCREQARAKQLESLLADGLRLLAGHELHCAHLGTDPEQADGSDYDAVCEWMDRVKQEVGGNG